MSLVCFITVIVVICVTASAQEPEDLALARQLASEATRKAAISRIVSSGLEKVPLLLSWTRNPPPQVDKYQLYVGLADVFGQMKTKEAIPFLIQNISGQRGLLYFPNVWLKTAAVIEGSLPFAKALVLIGPEASKAIIRQYRTMNSDDRLAGLFVVSRIQDPEARGFLDSVAGRASLEAYWANKGLKGLDERK